MMEVRSVSDETESPSSTRRWERARRPPADRRVGRERRGEFFYPNGNIKSQGQYKKLEVDCLSLETGGEFEGIILFHNGKKDGQWSYYSVLGELEKLEVWEDGVQLK